MWCANYTGRCAWVCVLAFGIGYVLRCVRCGNERTVLDMPRPAPDRAEEGGL